METNTLAVLVVAIVLFVFLSRRASSEANALGSPPRPGGADGSPSAGNALEHALGAAAGAGACVAGGAALGAPQLGAAIAPVCGKLGGWAAPYVRKGIVAGAKGVAAGATFAYHATEKGVILGMNAGQAVVTQPFDSAFIKPTQAAFKVATYGATAGERAINYASGVLPAPVKIALAPVIIPAKVTFTAVKTATSVAAPVVGVISSGVKSATSAVTSTVSKILPW